MPTKYTREDFRDHVAGERPYLRVSREPSPPVAHKLRKPGFMLLLTLSAIIIVLVLGNSMAKMAEYHGQPKVHGQGIIASKEIEKLTRYTLGIKSREHLIRKMQPGCGRCHSAGMRSKYGLIPLRVIRLWLRPLNIRRQRNLPCFFEMFNYIRYVKLHMPAPIFQYFVYAC